MRQQVSRLAIAMMIVVTVATGDRAIRTQGCQDVPPPGTVVAAVCPDTPRSIRVTRAEPTPPRSLRDDMR